MVRYADDFVVLCQTEAEAKEVLEYLRAWTTDAGLTLHPVKTRIVNAQSQGFDFLGWTFRGGKKCVVIAHDGIVEINTDPHVLQCHVARTDAFWPQHTAIR